MTPEAIGLAVYLFIGAGWAMWADHQNKYSVHCKRYTFIDRFMWMILWPIPAVAWVVFSIYWWIESKVKP